MPYPAVAPDIHQPLDVLANLTPQRAFNLEIVLDDVTDLDRFLFIQILYAATLIQTGLLTDLACGRRTDSEDIGKADDKALIIRDIYACNSCQRIVSFPTASVLALTLLVPLILANHTQNPFSPDYFAV